MSRDTPQSFNFEGSLEELEALVARMEQGELSLEDSLQAFERGIELTRACQQALATAEQKVEILIQKGEQLQTAPFGSHDQQ